MTLHTHLSQSGTLEGFFELTYGALQGPLTSSCALLPGTSDIQGHQQVRLARH